MLQKRLQRFTAKGIVEDRRTRPYLDLLVKPETCIADVSLQIKYNNSLLK